MARFISCAVLVVLAAAAGAGARVKPEKEGTFVEHRGRVADMQKGRDLPGVKVDAYAKESDVRAMDCLNSDGKIATATSGKKGTFILKISADKVNFVTRYCADGYAPRIDPTNDNERKAAIRPNPVMLVKQTSTTEEMKELLRQLQLTTRLKISKLNYSPEEIAAAMQSLPPEERAMMRGVYQGFQTPRMEFRQMVLTDVGRISMDLLSDFDYLFAVVPDQLCAAAEKSDPYGEWVQSRCRARVRKE